MIKATHISVQAGTKSLLSDVSVHIEQGKITAIIGPNGAGKSTLLHCLCGARTPQDGHVRFFDEAFSRYTLADLAKRRTVLTQALNIQFPFTALEIVQMGRNPYLADNDYLNDRDIVEQALAAVDVAHLATRIYPSLSGGEQQRVQIARVLAQVWDQDNAVVFLDEPTSALDLKHQHRLFQLLSDLARERNFAICVVMHDLNLTRHYAHSVVMLKAGVLYYQGATAAALVSEHIAEVFEIPAQLAFYDSSPVSQIEIQNSSTPKRKSQAMPAPILISPIKYLH